MPTLKREAILAAADIVSEEIEVPEWGGTVRVRVMTGAQRDAFEQSMRDRRALGTLGDNVRAAIVAASAVDDDGKALFSEADVEALGAKSWKALERITSASARLNLLTDDDVEAATKN